jgi:hypothetical protein
LVLLSKVWVSFPLWLNFAPERNRNIPIEAGLSPSVLEKVELPPVYILIYCPFSLTIGELTPSVSDASPSISAGWT